MVKKNINILKVKDIIIKDILQKIQYDNHLLRLFTGKNIGDDDFQELNNYNFNNTIIYNENLSKNITIKGENNKKNVNIEINHMKKIYKINIDFQEIYHNQEKNTQQYTISFDLEYEKCCNLQCNNTIMNVICLFCSSLCCIPLCKNEYDDDIHKYLDDL